MQAEGHKQIFTYTRIFAWMTILLGSAAGIGAIAYLKVHYGSSMTTRDIISQHYGLVLFLSATGTVVFGVLSAILHVQITKIETIQNSLHELILVDSLTKIYNRRKLEKDIIGIEADLQRRNKHAGLVMLDLDLFKEVNDKLGHISGDLVLQELAHLLEKLVRPDDMLYRYGGEEFVVITRETKLNEAAEIAERLRQSIEQHTFPTLFGTQKITVSIGIACIGEDSRSGSFHNGILALHRADQAMYKAKSNGRNCIVLETELDTTIDGENREVQKTK